MVRAARDACDERSEECAVLSNLVDSIERQLQEKKERRARNQQMETDHREATRELELLRKDEEAIKEQIQDLQGRVEDLRGQLGETQRIIEMGRQALARLKEKRKAMAIKCRAE